MKRNKNGFGQITKAGYKKITTPDGRRTFEHRYIIEQILKRPLIRSEIVHHLDGNKLNNSPTNLEICTQGEHLEKYRKTLTAGRKTDGLKILDWSNFILPPFRYKYHKIKKCSIDYCGRNAVSWGLCRRHSTSYHRWKTGNHREFHFNNSLI